MSSTSNKLLILGIRGIPACHGGFESFAESFALFMKQQGWDVTVYCQEIGKKPIYYSEWKGIQRVHVSVNRDCAFGTMVFDYKSVCHAVHQEGVVLTLGYNTAILSVFHRLYGQRTLMNMDGIEWHRDKWSFAQKIWLYCNEWLGARLANHLIADHPQIKKHLLRHTQEKKITVIPYAAKNIIKADSAYLEPYGLSSKSYVIIVARAEPENSILEIVKSFSKLSLGFKLVILGAYDAEQNTYHKKVLKAASKNVIFLGAIYQAEIVEALRFHARAYVHGHTVGGTNPSLIESMGAGNAIIAHGNKFNRWVIGTGGIFFENEKSLESGLQSCMDMNVLQKKSLQIKQHYLENFQFDVIHHAYLKIIEQVVKN